VRDSNTFKHLVDEFEELSMMVAYVSKECGIRPSEIVEFDEDTYWFDKLFYDFNIMLKYEERINKEIDKKCHSINKRY